MAKVFLIGFWFVVSPSSFLFAQKPIYISSYTNNGTHIPRTTSFIFLDSAIIIPIPTVDYSNITSCSIEVIESELIKGKDEGTYLGIKGLFSNGKPVYLLLGPRAIYVWYDREEIIYYIDLEKMYLLKKRRNG